METIKVNMNPNPLDVQTIHASQNDSEAREWGFELHNNGDVIDSSEISDQLVFKAYKGGTERILPENGSVPTTSPIIADIKYPQGLLTDQEFLYRQSPTEEDGLAKITDIKGNTLVWNQLVHNGNFADTSNWVSQSVGSTLSVSNNVATVTYNIGEYSVYNPALGARNTINQFNAIQGHKYYVSVDIKPTKAGYIYVASQTIGMFRDQNLIANQWNSVRMLGTAVNDGNLLDYIGINKADIVAGDSISYRNYQAFDLTQMGLDITDPSDFTSLFSLPYYDFNQGSLLSFNGNGIKTVGFNQWDEEWEAGALSVTDGSTINVNSYLRSKNFIPVISGKTYCRGISYQSDCRVFYYDANHSYIGNVATSSANTLFTIPSDVSFIKFHKYGANYDNNICINISNDKNGTYEPYTSSTLSLPISTYFPTGMKSAGSVYDELTPEKAITRIGSVDLGTLDWSLSSPLLHIFRGKLTDLNIKIPNAYDLPNALLANYLPYAYSPITASNDGCFAIGYRGAEGNVIVIIDNKYSDNESFISHISGQYLFYELATETETPITTASLVTENAEIPLSNEDGVLIGKCTEQLSENPGFFDAKIKLADADGECYSNKIQLHVERSPQ